MQDVVVPLWLLACTFGAWLGFRLSLAMHEGAADSRAPTVARLLVTSFCLSITTLFFSVALQTDLSLSAQVPIMVMALVTAVMQLLQIWTEKPEPGKDCQGRDIVE